jgi:hypothetical protein
MINNVQGAWGSACQESTNDTIDVAYIDHLQCSQLTSKQLVLHKLHTAVLYNPEVGDWGDNSNNGNNDWLQVQDQEFSSLVQFLHSFLMNHNESLDLAIAQICFMGDSHSTAIPVVTAQTTLVLSRCL